ncbi:MAG: heme exporter protein CcmD [Pseudomonadota bacterium]
MSFLGEHGGFILGAYLGTILAIGGLTLLIIRDYRVQRARLDELEAQGIVRRSARTEQKLAETPRDAATAGTAGQWDTP